MKILWFLRKLEMDKRSLICGIILSFFIIALFCGCNKEKEDLFLSLDQLTLPYLLYSKDVQRIEFEEEFAEIFPAKNDKIFIFYPTKITKEIELKGRKNYLVIFANGAKINAEFPKVRVFVNDQLVGEFIAKPGEGEHKLSFYQFAELPMERHIFEVNKKGRVSLRIERPFQVESEIPGGSVLLLDKICVVNAEKKDYKLENAKIPIKLREGKKVILLGIDGLDPYYLTDLINQGKVPNFAQICVNGAFGTMKTLESLFSPAIFTTIVTSAHQEEHGIPFFTFPVRGKIEVNTAASYFRKRKALWNIVSENGGRVFVGGWRCSWPAEKVNGTIISELFRDNVYGVSGEGRELVDRYLNDASFHNQLKTDFINYFQIDPDKSAAGRQLFGGIFREKILLNAFKELHQKEIPPLSILYFKIIDSLSHTLWHYHQPFSIVTFPRSKDFSPTPERQVIERCYTYTDQVLGEILKLMDSKTTLIIVSDHGFQAVESRFIPYLIKKANLNVLLEQMGLMKTDKRGIIWDKTQAYSLTGDLRFFFDANALCLNIKGREPEGIIKANKYEKKAKEIRKKLLELKTMDGRRLFNEVIIQPYCSQKEGLFHPDMIIYHNPTITPKDEYIISGKRYSCSNYLEIYPAGEEETGIHRDLATIILYGDEIRKDGYPIFDATVYDITPTILTLLGLPIGADMKGKVLLDAFEPEAKSSLFPEIVKTYEGEMKVEIVPLREDILKEVTDNLRALGYIR